MPASKDKWLKLVIDVTKLEYEVNTLKKEIKKINEKNDERKQEVNRRNLAIIVALITLLSVLIGRLLDFFLSHL